ncbi:MAG: TRAP transporter large permease subunit, partial [Clostridia bacterium]
APVLIGLGFEPLGVHMFILFFAAMSTITPPVAMTSYAAATIADASPMKVGFMSMKVGIVAYILPFIFIFNPAILLYGSFAETAAVAVCAFIGTAVLAMGLEGWFFGMKTGFFIRALLVSAGILAVFANIQLLLISAVLTAVVTAVYIIRRTALKKIAVETE